MDPREELLSEESWRYAAECRRLARLSRSKSKPAPVAGDKILRPVERLAQFWTQNFDPYSQQPRFVSRLSRR